jgi:hypothetical protein
MLRRTRIGPAVAVLLAATTAALPASASTQKRPRSGIAGQVVIGPTCPVERVGESCEHPYQATITILREPSRRRVATVRSSADGRFRIRLRPGRYELVPRNRSRYPSARPQEAVVHRHRYTRVVIEYRTGIA